VKSIFLKLVAMTTSSEYLLTEAALSLICILLFILLRWLHKIHQQVPKPLSLLHLQEMVL
jgi:hypothetical protein